MSQIRPRADELGPSAFTITRDGEGLASQVDVDDAPTVITRDGSGLVSAVSAGGTTWELTRDAEGLVQSGSVA